MGVSRLHRFNIYANFPGASKSSNEANSHVALYIELYIFGFSAAGVRLSASLHSSEAEAEATATAID